MSGQLQKALQKFANAIGKPKKSEAFDDYLARWRKASRRSGNGGRSTKTGAERHRDHRRGRIGTQRRAEVQSAPAHRGTSAQASDRKAARRLPRHVHRVEYRRSVSRPAAVSLQPAAQAGRGERFLPRRKAEQPRSQPAAHAAALRRQPDLEHAAVEVSAADGTAVLRSAAVGRRELLQRGVGRMAGAESVVAVHRRAANQRPRTRRRARSRTSSAARSARAARSAG